MSELFEVGKRELFLLPRLLQEKLGELFCKPFLLLYKSLANIHSQTEHKLVHKSKSNPLRNLFPPKVVSEPDPATGFFNPFPTFSFTGPLRPVYPLSPWRIVPKSIPYPEYAADGVPRSERTLAGRTKIPILDKEQQEGQCITLETFSWLFWNLNEYI